MRGTLTTYPTVDIEDTWSEGWVGEEEHSGAEQYHSKTNHEVEVGATQSDQPGGIKQVRTINTMNPSTELGNPQASA